MGETEDPRQALSSKDVAIRAAATRDLARCGGWDDVVSLVQHAKEDKSSAVRLYAAASAADERTSVSTSGWDLFDLVGWSDASSSAWSEADHLSCAGSEDGGE